MIRRITAAEFRTRGYAKAAENKVKAARNRQKEADANVTLDRQLKKLGVPLPEHEKTFHPTRKWQFDRAYVDQKIGIEIDGGIWRSGGHNSGRGYSKDRTKDGAAIALGWVVLRFTYAMVADGSAAKIIQAAFKSKSGAK